MATVTILLAPRDIMRDVYFNDDAQRLVKQNLSRYEKAHTFQFEPKDLFYKEEAAEEAFDLTNNPYRQEERISTYGRKRSVSVGDVVEVDDTKFLCASFGWEVI